MGRGSSVSSALAPAVPGILSGRSRALRGVDSLEFPPAGLWGALGTVPG